VPIKNHPAGIGTIGEGLAKLAIPCMWASTARGAASMLPHAGQELRIVSPIDSKKMVRDDDRKHFEIFNIMVSPSCIG
jgi:hypothetical protein